MENFLKKLGEKNSKSESKRKIENLCFFIGILIITLILMKSIWKGNTEKSKLDEKELIIDRTKEYLFVLEHELIKKNQEIKSLKKYKKENKALKSTISWKITKPLRWISNLLK